MEEFINHEREIQLGGISETGSEDTGREKEISSAIWSSVNKVQFKLLEGGVKYKKSTLKVCGIIGSFEKPEEQAQISEKLYTYMMQDPEPTREQVIAEANRIADEMRKEQEKE